MRRLRVTKVKTSCTPLENSEWNVLIYLSQDDIASSLSISHSIPQTKQLKQRPTNMQFTTALYLLASMASIVVASDGPGNLWRRGGDFNDLVLRDPTLNPNEERPPGGTLCMLCEPCA